jgi:N-acetylglucosaminyl-diphospho-decaprenol L-rhamnosyltransferase
VTERATLAVIVVSYNVRGLLRACLAATYASLTANPELDATVWVVDNASGDGSAEMVATEFPQARLIARQDNLGFAGGNNLALRELGFVVECGAQAKLARSTSARVEAERPRSRPDLVLLLNPDAEPLGDAIGQMAGFLLSHPRAGGAAAHLQYPDGRFQHGAYRFPGLAQLWFDFFLPRPRRLLDSRLNGRYPQRLWTGRAPFPVDFGLGAALMVRCAAIEAAGLLDEGYFMYAEEVDWCWRMQRAGWPFYGIPAARVIHHGGASTRQFRGQSFINLWRSRHRLYSRFYGPARRRLAGLIVRIGMAAEARRARADAVQGRITQREADERVTASQQVTALFAQSLALRATATDRNG